ncbi:MAG: AsmA family protein, partial [Pedobacter sp.]|nr:AsmA family protein [Pedobacter sp.]
MPRWSKIALKILGVILILISIGYIAIAIYVNSHKKELLTTITKELNKNLDGSLVVQNMEPSFLKGFPGVSLTLKNVVMKDKQWSQHQHTLLNAKLFDISVNTSGLLRGTIEIDKITISNASIYLFTDSNGYTNTSIFRKKKSVDSVGQSSSSTEINKFQFKNVDFVFDNQKSNKLFQFAIDRLTGKIDYTGSGWDADVNLNALTK